MTRHDLAKYVHVDFHGFRTCSIVVLDPFSMLTILWLLLPLPQGVNEHLLC